MCLTLPDTLISVVGVEKVLPSWQDLEVFLALLPRSSTAERMNPYTTIWTGVADGDGPRNFHLVLLDNGRTATLADPTGRQALRCIRCSACLNVCPVYERAGGHAYGSPYPGPIGAILSPQLRGVTSEIDASLPYASSLCGACYEVCPVAINIPEVLVELRARSVRGAPAPGRTGRVPAVRLRAELAAPPGRGPAGRVGRPAPRRPVRPHPPPPAAPVGLDRHPRRPRPAPGVLPRLVVPDQRRRRVSTAREEILDRIRAADQPRQPGPRGDPGPGRRRLRRAAARLPARASRRGRHRHRRAVRRARGRLPRRRRARPRGGPARGHRPGAGRRPEVPGPGRTAAAVAGAADRRRDRHARRPAAVRPRTRRGAPA